MEILFVLLAGLYVICAIGYYKITVGLTNKNNIGEELTPGVVKVAIVILSSIWPLGMVWALTNWAIK